MPDSAGGPDQRRPRESGIDASAECHRRTRAVRRMRSTAVVAVAAADVAFSGAGSINRPIRRHNDDHASPPRSPAPGCWGNDRKPDESCAAWWRPRPDPVTDPIHNAAGVSPEMVAVVPAERSASWCSPKDQLTRCARWACIADRRRRVAEQPLVNLPIRARPNLAWRRYRSAP